MKNSIFLILFFSIPICLFSQNDTIAHLIVKVKENNTWTPYSSIEYNYEIGEKITTLFTWEKEYWKDWYQIKHLFFEDGVTMKTIHLFKDDGLWEEGDIYNYYFLGESKYKRRYQYSRPDGFSRTYDFPKPNYPYRTNRLVYDIFEEYKKREMLNLDFTDFTMKKYRHTGFDFSGDYQIIYDSENRITKLLSDKAEVTILYTNTSMPNDILTNYEDEAIYPQEAKSSVEMEFENVEIFPNPTPGILMIRNVEEYLGSVRFAITDVSGKYLIREKILETNSINLENMKSGVYILRLTKEDQLKSYVIINGSVIF